MPLQTPEEMENTPIPKLGSITWTKCSERMPPDDDSFNCISECTMHNPIQIISAGKLHLLRQFGRLPSWAIWAPYTPEAWEELNK